MARHPDTGLRRLNEEERSRAQAHLHLVEALAWRQFRRCGEKVPLEELLGEAQLALVYGASRYDGDKGVPAGAYLTMVIKHRLVQAVTRWRRGGRLDHVRFTDLEVAASGGETAFDVPCPRTGEPNHQVAASELLEQVRRELPIRWFRVLMLYFVENYSLEAIGQQLGISRERVRQLLGKAIARARSRCGNIDAGCKGL